MKKYLPLLIVAIVTFAIVWLVMRIVADDPEAPELRSGKRTVFQSPGTEPHDLKARDPKNHTGVVSRARKIPESEVVPGNGRLLVRASLPDGTSPQDLRITTQPALPVFQPGEGGLAVDQVPAGTYTVTLHGGDLIPVVQRGVLIEAGEERRLTFRMLRGVRPAGRVLDAETQEPIVGAWVDFNGMANARTGSDGGFRIGRVLPKTALDVITVANKDYGQIPFKGLLIEDIGNMKLFLGGGRGVVHAEIVNGTSIEFPKDAFLRVTLPPLFEVRREMPLEGQQFFTLRKLYTATFRFEIHFPGGEFPVQRQLVEIPPYKPEDPPDDVRIRFELKPGGTLKGRFKAPARFTSGMIFQLRDRRNHVVAESKVDAEGNYQFNNLEPMEYNPVIMSGSAPFQLPQITITGEGEIRRDVDVLRKKWAK